MTSTDVQRHRFRELFQGGAVVTTAQLTRYRLWSHVNAPVMQARQAGSLTFLRISKFELPVDRHELTAMAAITELRSQVARIKHLRWSGVKKLSPCLHYAVIIDDRAEAVVHEMLVDSGERWSRITHLLSNVLSPQWIYLTCNPQRANQVREWPTSRKSQPSIGWLAVATVDISTPASAPFSLDLWETDDTRAPRWLKESVLTG